MKHQNLEIGTPLQITVQWYDKVPEPPVEKDYEGEVLGWRDTQVIVRVKQYAVIRFWKANGLEVGNPDHARRGFKVDMNGLKESVKPDGLDIPIPLDTDA